MTIVTPTKAAVVTTMLVLAALGRAAHAVEAAPATLARMTDAKLAADLGKLDDAVAAFRAIADDASAPDALRADALLRLAALHASAGRVREAVEARDEVWKSHSSDPEVLRQLVAAVTAVTPEPRRWESVWKRVRILREISPDGVPSLRAEYPDAHPPIGGEADPISIDVADAELGDLLRLFGQVGDLNVVVDPSVQLRSHRVTAAPHDLPWTEALRRICDAHGLAAERTGNVLRIAKPRRLARSVDGRSFTGAPIDLAVRDATLESVLAELARASGLEIEVDPAIKSTITLELHDVPWDQALQLVVDGLELDMTRDGRVIRVTSPTVITRPSGRPDDRGYFADEPGIDAGVESIGRALQRYQLQHRAWPIQRDEAPFARVAAVLGENLPVAGADGTPLRYRSDGRSFTLTAISPREGKVTRSWKATGTIGEDDGVEVVTDWVVDVDD